MTPTIGRRDQQVESRMAPRQLRPEQKYFDWREVVHEIFNLKIIAVVISQILSHERHVGTFPESVTGSLP